LGLPVNVDEHYPRAGAGTISGAELERWATFPLILGVADVAAFLHVSPQQVPDIREFWRFPDPMMDLMTGPVWLRSSIETFLTEEAARLS
jgi:hypothetical protein